MQKRNDILRLVIDKSSNGYDRLILLEEILERCLVCQIAMAL